MPNLLRLRFNLIPGLLALVIGAGAGVAAGHAKIRADSGR